MKVTNNRPEGTAFQANFKTRSGALLNVYAEDVESFSQRLEDLEGTAAQIAAIEGVLGAVSAAAPVAAPPSQQPKPQGTPVAQPTGGGRPAGAAPTCDQGCGPKIFKEGTGRTGKPYKAWFCSNPDRNAQCKPEWVN